MLALTLSLCRKFSICYFGLHNSASLLHRLFVSRAVEMTTLTVSFRCLFVHFNYSRVHSSFGQLSILLSLWEHCFALKINKDNPKNTSITVVAVRKCNLFRLLPSCETHCRSTPEGTTYTELTVKTSPETSLYSKMIFCQLLNYPSTPLTAILWLSLFFLLRIMCFFTHFEVFCQ